MSPLSDRRTGSGGTIRFDGDDITALNAKAMRPKRRAMQIILQDPYGALNPRMSAEDIIMEPLVIHGAKADAATNVENGVRVVEWTSLLPLFSRFLPDDRSSNTACLSAAARAS